MGRKFKIWDQDKLYFVTFTVIQWRDIFIRREYRDIFLDSLNSNEKGLRYLEYIHNNPVKAGFILSPEDYLYSSANNYAGLPKNLIEVILIE
jgi:hypothetical protein